MQLTWHLILLVFSSALLPSGSAANLLHVGSRSASIEQVWKDLSVLAIVYASFVCSCSKILQCVYHYQLHSSPQRFPFSLTPAYSIVSHYLDLIIANVPIFSFLITSPTTLSLAPSFSSFLVIRTVKVWQLKQHTYASDPVSCATISNYTIAEDCEAEALQYGGYQLMNICLFGTIVEWLSELIPHVNGKVERVHIYQLSRLPLLLSLLHCFIS